MPDVPCMEYSIFPTKLGHEANVGRYSIQMGVYIYIYIHALPFQTREMSAVWRYRVYFIAYLDGCWNMFIFHSVWNFIIPSHFHIFQGVKPPTRYCMIYYCISNES